MSAIRINPAQRKLLEWAAENGLYFHWYESFYRYHFGYDRLHTLVKRGLLAKDGRLYFITDLGREAIA